MVWRCLLHYYPSDRSARVEDPKWDDDAYDGDHWNKSKLPMRFRNARASCRRTWGDEIGGEMSIDEFEYTPKHGLRETFHYRMNMWRRPNVNVLGVTFEILDGSMVDLFGYDGSLSDASDASMSYFLQRRGEEVESDADGLAVKVIAADKKVETLSLRPSELRAALGIMATEKEAESQSLFKPSNKVKTCVS